VTRLLGIDLGTRRIGIALADTATGSVVPLTTVRRRDPERDLATLRSVIREQRVDEVVLGLPRNMDGTEGTQAVDTRSWADAVLGRLGLRYCLRDERLTSVAADDLLGRSRRGRSGGPPSAAARNTRRARCSTTARRCSAGSSCGGSRRASPADSPPPRPGSAPRRYRLRTSLCSRRSSCSWSP
jgi:putative holliday junction resolvase